MSQPDLPKLPPAKPLPRVRRRMVSRWWFNQMRQAVDKAPEPLDHNLIKTEVRLRMEAKGIWREPQ